MRLHTAAAIACWIGVPFSAAAAAPEPPPAPPAPTALQKPDAGIQYFRTNSPGFPPLARRFSIEGRVVAKVTIDTSGVASCAVVTSSGSLLLDRSMLDWCAESPKFTPAFLNGAPEPYTFKVAYTFQLDGDPLEGVCRDVSSYAQPLSGERGQLIESLAVIDRSRVDATREELVQMFRDHLDDVSQAFKRPDAPATWPIANATPLQVHTWLVEHREAIAQRFGDSVASLLGRGGAFDAYRDRQRRCIFGALSLPELRAAAAFQRTAAGAAVLRTVHFSGERFDEAVQAAMRFADLGRNDLYAEVEATFPGFLESLSAVMPESEAP